MTDLTLATLLPPNATALETAVDTLLAARIHGVASPMRALWSAQDCPADLLPYMAWGLSIDQWDATWSEPVRRARVASAIAVQRHKGTIDAVRRVIASFGGDFAISEWWQQSPVGTAHTFTLTLSLPSASTGAPDATFVDTVVAEVTAAKPLRSHFDFVLATSSRLTLGLCAVARPVIHARLTLTAPALVTPDNALTVGGSPLTLEGVALTIGD